MKNKQTIKIAELRRAIENIFDHIQENLKVEFFELEEDNYWDVDENLYDATKKPEVDEVGSLYDDWEFLEKMTRENSVPPMLMHVWPILRYMSDKVEWYGRKKSK